ncbi:hypothetical protein TNCV_4295761 [Trichonephila clavipes]|nr:hypothetical protein TNCV_4295761 [Trichonephila clavipes]
MHRHVGLVFFSDGGLQSTKCSSDEPQNGCLAEGRPLFAENSTEGVPQLNSGGVRMVRFAYLTSDRDEAHFWLNVYVNKQNCRIGSEANPQVYVETPLHPEKLTVWCALWAGGILVQKR